MLLVSKKILAMDFPHHKNVQSATQSGEEIHTGHPSSPPTGFNSLARLAHVMITGIRF
jgi:hypothetical protein